MCIYPYMQSLDMKSCVLCNIPNCLKCYYANLDSFNTDNTLIPSFTIDQFQDGGDGPFCA